VSDEHVEIVRRLAESINTGDVPPEILTDDFELKNATTAVTDATYHGYEGALQWRQDFFDVVDDPHFEIIEVLAAADDYVVISNHLSGRGTSSGVPVDLRWASVFWFREGKIARCVGFNSRRGALAAVGLSR
jgi:ketosteroid isomerase-like protein